MSNSEVDNEDIDDDELYESFLNDVFIRIE